MIIGRLLLPVHALLHRLVRSWPRHDPPRQQPDRQVGQGEGHRQRGALRRLCWSRGLPPHHKVEATTHHLQELKINIMIFPQRPSAHNKNFPYHVRTTQIGVLEAISSHTTVGNHTLESFGHHGYGVSPANGR